jgi:RNA polymerase sigma-70 factor, ECF subfamily
MDETTRMQAAFDRAMESQFRGIYAYFRRLGAGPAAADDLVQETFLAAWQGLAKVRREADLKAWLYGIAYRRYLKHRTQFARDAADHLDEEIAGSSRDDPGGDARLTAQLVRRTVRRLPDRYLQPLALVYWGGLSYEEAARVLAVPVGTLGWRVHKGLELARKALQEEGFEDDAISPAPQTD